MKRRISFVFYYPSGKEKICDDRGVEGKNDNNFVKGMGRSWVDHNEPSVYRFSMLSFTIFFNVILKYDE